MTHIHMGIQQQEWVDNTHKHNPSDKLGSCLSIKKNPTWLPPELELHTYNGHRILSDTIFSYNSGARNSFLVSFV